MEELESEEYQEDSALATELSKISELGGNIALEIDQVFSAHNFSLDGFFSQLSTQSISLNGIVSPLLHKINSKLSKIKQGSVTGFVVDFIEDIKKIANAVSDLENSIDQLVKSDISSIGNLISLKILSQSDIDIVEKFSESLQETPDALETKYPSNLLIVDDNPSNTEYLNRKLRAAKHSILVANTGSEAEDYINSSTPIDLILLDILMPGMSGYDFLGRNKKVLKGRNIPVIVVSSLDEQETVFRCLESGAQDYVTKPINFMILAARINSALERKHLLDREEQHLARIEKEKQKNEELILNILPQPIAARMMANEYLIADSVDECSILFGDIVEIPKIPSIVKSRPISKYNHNSVLLKLNKVRHFTYTNDNNKFEEKKDILIGKKLKSLVLYPMIMKIGATNSEKTASINVGTSPIPIGFEKLTFPSINLVNLLIPCP